MADTLSKYRSMRNFKETPEPRGKIKRSPAKQGGGRLFIVQKHDATRLHYDFRLELDGVLLSWAVTRGPSLDPADKRLAVRTEDHPIEYGGFEGVIPSGYGAGTVMLWDRGEWAPLGNAHEGLRKGSLKFALAGERLKGGFALVRMKPRPGEKPGRENWLLIKERDQWADESTIATDEWTTSVKSDRDLEEIASKGESYKRGKDYTRMSASQAKRRPAQGKPAARKPLKKGAAKTSAAKKPQPKRGARASRGRVAPRFVEPQLAVLESAPPEGAGWIHEMKFDGYRILAVIKDGKAKLYTRTKQDWTHRYARIASAFEKLGVENAALDGELVAMDEGGRASFAMMQQAAENERIPLVYHAFDLLNEDGEDVRELPLLERKKRLKALLSASPSAIQFSKHVTETGEKVIASACALGFEGLVSKRADAAYSSGRSPLWIKSKCLGSDEFVIGGYRLSDKPGRPFRSLLLGEFDKGKLIYRGRVGTGFNDETLSTLAPRLKRLARSTSPFEATPSDVRRGVVWVRPELVAQIAYFETTPDGYLRHPSYLGLREDKPAKAVKAGTSSVSLAKAKAATAKTAKTVKRAPKKAAGPSASSWTGSLRLTSPDKLLWPDAGITKLDLANYYREFADYLLPHVKDRPLSLVRCPEGFEGECFFQKHHNPSTPDAIETVSIKDKAGGSSDYLVIRNAAGLVSTAQIGALELHAWGSRADSLEKPERIVFDLDPDEGLDFADVKKAAFEMRDVLKALGLESWPLLTGGKGVHVIVPVARTREWPEVKAFASGLANKVAATSPDRYVAQASKAKRKGRIFIDWLRNERGSTAIAPFSPRRRAGAPVATPVSWDELRGFKSAAPFTMKTIGARLAKLKSDPWKGYGTTKQSLRAEVLRAVS